MKKCTKLLSCLILMFSQLFTACKKEEDIPVVDNTPACTLTQLTSYQGGTIKLQYDAKGKISMITYNERNQDYPLPLTRDAAGNIIKILTSGSEGKGERYTSYDYNTDNQMTKQTHWYWHPASTTYSKEKQFIFEYNSNKHLIKYSKYTFQEDIATLRGYVTYEVNTSGNATLEKVYEADNTLNRSNEYEYGNKFNPFTIEAFLSDNDFPTFGFYFSKNFITKLVQKDANGKVTQTETVDAEYNDKGYTVKYTDPSDLEPFIFTFQYDCK